MKSIQTFLVLLLLAANTIPLVLAQSNSNDREWERKRINTVIITQNGDMYEGQLLVADSVSLALWMSQAPFSPDSKEVSVLIVKPSEIDQILVRRSGAVGRKTLTGTAIGSGLGSILGGMASSDPGILSAGSVILGGIIIFGGIGSASGLAIGQIHRIHADLVINGEKNNYLAFLPKIQKKYALIDNPASVQLADFSPPTQPSRTSLLTDTKKERPSGISRLHIGGGLGAQFSSVLQLPNQAILDQGLTLTENYNRVRGQTVDLSYSITPTWQIGLGAQFMSSQRSSGDFSFFTDSTSYQWSVSQDIRPSEFLLTLDHIFAPVSRPLPRRMELAMGGGISLNYLKVYGYVRGSGQIATTLNDFTSFSDVQTKTSNLFIPGLHLRTRVDYYLLPEVSLFGQLGGTLNLNQMLPTNTIPIENLGEIGLSRHKINASKLHLLFGLRFHFAPKNFQ